MRTSTAFLTKLWLIVVLVMTITDVRVFGVSALPDAYTAQVLLTIPPFNASASSPFPSFPDKMTVNAIIEVSANLHSSRLSILRDAASANRTSTQSTILSFVPGQNITHTAWNSTHCLESVRPIPAPLNVSGADGPKFRLENWFLGWIPFATSTLTESMTSSEAENSSRVAVYHTAGPDYSALFSEKNATYPSQVNVTYRMVDLAGHVVPFNTLMFELINLTSGEPSPSRFEAPCHTQRGGDVVAAAQRATRETNVALRNPIKTYVDYLPCTKGDAFLAGCMGGAIASSIPDLVDLMPLYFDPLTLPVAMGATIGWLLIGAIQNAVCFQLNKACHPSWPGKPYFPETAENCGCETSGGGARFLATGGPPLLGACWCVNANTIDCGPTVGTCGQQGGPRGCRPASTCSRLAREDGKL